MVKYRPLLLLFVLFLVSFENINLTGNKYFDLNHALRINLLFSGDSEYQSITTNKLFKDNKWSGSDSQLISPFNLGEYRYFILNIITGDTIFLRGFSTLFEEWRTTNDAKKGSKEFSHTLLMPFPKQNCQLIIEGRNKNGRFYQLHDLLINPKKIEPVNTVPLNYSVKTIYGENNSASNFDLLFISEGYQQNEMNIFFNHVSKLSKYLFATEPFKSNKNNFTIRALAIPSTESGISDPVNKVFKKTIFGSSFNTLGVERYLQISDAWKVFEIAALAPHDHIIILANTNKYGGGGIYNHFSVAAANNKLSGNLLIHELGHGLAGLGDEYFDSEVSYNEYINLKAEPWQPNLTTMVDFNKKWKKLIKPSTPVPTPVRPAFEHTTGVFEGGGYVSKGVFRPSIFCRMRNSNTDNFCEVCNQTITMVTKFYTQ